MSASNLVLSKEHRARITSAFSEYVSAYDLNDPKIALKIAHTYRVAALAETIACSVSPELADLSWLCGMLHDIGRFEQIRRYNTFIDSQSVDHAGFGADLLFQEGLLERIVPNDLLSGEDLSVLELSIRSHSALRIPDQLSDRERMCCNILRDADKIDIFRVNCDTPMEDIYNVTTEELKTGAVSPAVKDCYIHRTAVPRAIRRSAVDSLVGHICLTFELVYPISRQIAKDQGYIDRLLDFRSDNPDTEAWFRYMQRHLWQ